MNFNIKNAAFFVFIFTAILASANAQSTEQLTMEEQKKLSPITILFLDHGDDKFMFPFTENGKNPALVQVKNTSSVSYILKEYPSYGNVFSCNISRSDVLKLAKDPNVNYIEISARWNRLRMWNDTTRILSHVNEVQAGSQNGLNMDYSGAGVIAGIVDIGFQTDNPTFVSADGSVFRIKKFWMQSDKSGSAPAGFGFGSEYSLQNDILNVRDDDGTHGTHVAGITGGSGYTTTNLKLRGMAPEADFVFVGIKYANDTLGGSAKGDYVVANPNILNAYAYVFNYAQSQGKPAVCNLSWGMHTGPHDGNSLFDKAIEQLTGKGKLLVGAAGNDGGNQMHCGALLNGDTAYTFAIDRSRNDYKHENCYVDAWGDSAGTLGVNLALFDTSGNKLLEIPFLYAGAGSAYKKIATNGSDTLWYTWAGNASFTNNGKPEILIEFESNHASYQRIRMGFVSEKGFHAWNSGQTYRWTSGGFLDKVKGNDQSGKYLNGTSNYSVSENGGTGKSVITVGSYVARNNWIDFNGTYHAQNWVTPGEISGFSARGNTADNRIKPDVIAPGQNVSSSVNYRTYAGWMADGTTDKTSYNGQDQYWVLFSGTSMASPHVAGIVALLLQADPDLTPAEAGEILRSTAYRDNFTGNDSNSNAGYGKVDALAAMRKCIQLGVKKGTLARGLSLYPNPGSGADLHLVWPAAAGQTINIEIRDLNGRLVKAISSNANEYGIAVLSLDIADGIYTCSAETKGMKSVNRLLIRH